jgi:transcriptional regulator
MNEHKQSWSADEEHLLLELRARGVSQHEIADQLRRTVISVRSRLAVLRRVKRIATKQRKGG